MVLENDKDIDWWWSLLAKVFSWLLLAGYIVFPSTFASLRRSRALESMGVVGYIVSRGLNDFLISLASILSGSASIGLAWLWFKWRTNYIWVNQQIIIPTLVNSLMGFFSTLLNLYTVHGGEWSTTAIVTATVTAWWLFASCILCLVYRYLLNQLQCIEVDDVDQSKLSEKI
ncbi:PHO85 cyclin-1 [Colletotrichum tofieldiae]|nr:PHO85 cyclin-1 [Colletotrichum tofieldiae]